jgi:hypothetical protein
MDLGDIDLRVVANGVYVRLSCIVQVVLLFWELGHLLVGDGWHHDGDGLEPYICTRISRAGEEMEKAHTICEPTELRMRHNDTLLNTKHTNPNPREELRTRE